MKADKQIQAHQLRHQGYSVREITMETGCSKSSISKWVRNIELTHEQIKNLKSNQDKGRAKAANHPNSPKRIWDRIRNDISLSSEDEIPLAKSGQS